MPSKMYFSALMVGLCTVVLLGSCGWFTDAHVVINPLRYPLHASCHANWTFGLNCSEVNNKLVDQVKKWSGRDNCPDNKGEKCLYKIVGQSNTQLNTSHTTPSKGYVDNQFFNFYQQSNDMCLTTGFSTSKTIYAFLDYGTNYCNLHNLITGSGLDKVPKYSEITSDKICTQYSSANCDVY